MAGLGDFPAAAVLKADDLARAKRFYIEVLGLKEMAGYSSDDMLFLTAGDGTMIEIYGRPGMPAPQNTTLGFGIPADQFDAVVAELRGKGVVFEDYDLPEMGLKTVNGVAEMGDNKAAWFKDTEANIINIETM